tara:strand:+ start:49 stop:489 length:441 start_codon:yes stop_codon:yes gene_type:complete
MPTINITEMVSDLKEYLPPEGNNLSDRNLTTISENVVANSIPEDDEAYYSEALCKALKAAATMNNSRYIVDGANLLEEQVGKVRFKYSEENSKDIWRDYIKTLPDLCPYLPKGGYTLPLSIGMIINSGEELKVPFCTSYEDEILIL